MNLKITLIIVVTQLIVIVTLKAQNYNLTYERTTNHFFTKQLELDKNFHSGIKPYYKNEVNKIINYDSIITLHPYKGSHNVVKHLTNRNLINIKNKNYLLSINPIINTGLTMENNDVETTTLNESSFGISLKSGLRKKWSGEWDFLLDNSTYPSYIDAIVKEKNNSPGYGYAKNDKAIFSQGNITYTANNIFAFQAGYGKNFIGDGYRSLFLSDNANSYPYFKVTANIWKIKYMALYTNFQDIRFSDGNYSNYKEKFAAIHYLSYNATKWLNIGFFESIIFQAQEGNFYRGFDIAYLNPIIFLRSTEFAQGSADNALLGGSIKVKVKQKNIFYGQLVLDEFLLKELRNGNGWWGNKYGIQTGLKMYNFLGVTDLKLQLEYNIVRPFTYSYYYQSSSNSTLQNYGHFNAALAHPLGANFKETFLSLSYHKKRWVVEASSTIAKVGFDTNTIVSVGQDIYRPNNNRAADFNHATTQGQTTDIINSTLKFSYIINPKSQLLLQFGATHRLFKNDFTDTSTNLFFIGLKTAIINRYFDI